MANRPVTMVAAAFATWQAERAIGITIAAHCARDPIRKALKPGSSPARRCGSAVEGKVSGKGVRLHGANVRFWHKVDIAVALSDVRCRG
jgi:hypothetical protein